jgi:hypothetical protein
MHDFVISDLLSNSYADVHANKHALDCSNTLLPEEWLAVRASWRVTLDRTAKDLSLLNPLRSAGGVMITGA